MKLDDGKYEFVGLAGGLLCLRYGGAWRDFVGDHAVTRLFNVAEDAVAALRYYRDQCSGAEPSISVFQRMADEVLEQVGDAT